MRRPFLQPACLALSLTVAQAGAAQMHQHEMAHDSSGSCDLCSPRVFVDGAALFRAGAALPSATSDKTTPLVRARLEIGSFVPHLGLVSQMELTPADGPTPSLQFGLKAWALGRSSAVNASLAVGVTDYRQGIGDQSPGAFVTRGWGQLGLEYRSPLHELTVYAQAGVPFSRASRASYQLGASHPLAPYKLHIP